MCESQGETPSFPCHDPRGCWVIQPPSGNLVVGYHRVREDYIWNPKDILVCPLVLPCPVKNYDNQKRGGPLRIPTHLEWRIESLHQRTPKSWSLGWGQRKHRMDRGGKELHILVREEDCRNQAHFLTCSSLHALCVCIYIQVSPLSSFSLCLWTLLAAGWLTVLFLGNTTFGWECDWIWGIIIHLLTHLQALLLFSPPFLPCFKFINFSFTFSFPP